MLRSTMLLQHYKNGGVFFPKEKRVAPEETKMVKRKERADKAAERAR
jgi:hypothetical protein